MTFAVSTALLTVVLVGIIVALALAMRHLRQRVDLTNEHARTLSTTIEHLQEFSRETDHIAQMLSQHQRAAPGRRRHR